jgi:hypothetical protein
VAFLWSFRPSGVVFGAGLVVVARCAGRSQVGVVVGEVWSVCGGDDLVDGCGVAYAAVGVADLASMMIASQDRRLDLLTPHTVAGDSTACRAWLV